MDLNLWPHPKDCGPLLFPGWLLRFTCDGVHGGHAWLARRAHVRAQDGACESPAPDEERRVSNKRHQSGWSWESQRRLSIDNVSRPKQREYWGSHHFQVENFSRHLSLWICIDFAPTSVERRTNPRWGRTSHEPTRRTAPASSKLCWFRWHKVMVYLGSSVNKNTKHIKTCDSFVPTFSTKTGKQFFYSKHLLNVVLVKWGIRNIE